MITKSGKIRTEYSFARPLDPAEGVLLVKLIGWRAGSSVIRDEAGSVVGAIAHPDDLHAFRRELRKCGAKIGVRVMSEPVVVEPSVRRKIAH